MKSKKSMKTPGRNIEVANYIIEEESKFGSMDKVGRIYNDASIDNYMDAQMSTHVAQLEQDPME